MKAIAYSIQAKEKELLVRANAKRYKLTLISNRLNYETSTFSAGKEVVIISDEDILDLPLLIILERQGIRKIVTRSHTIEHIDSAAAKQLGLKILNLDEHLSQEESAWQIIDLLSL